MEVKQSEKKQHVDLHRKIALRKTLIEKAGELEGAYYVPFIGDGDIACELYQGNKILIRALNTSHRKQFHAILH